MLSFIKSHVPWRVKIAAKIILSRFPLAYKRWQNFKLFRHGHMDCADYAMDIFDAHLKRASVDKRELQGKTILEIGPGDSIATAIIAYSYGARALLLDAGAFATDNIEMYRTLCNQLSYRGLSVPDISNVSTIDDILECCNAQYISSGLDGWISIPDSSVDFVFSQAVLEHIRKHEFFKLQQECCRVMKLGTPVSHRVDLRDHLGGALNNLRFPERMWESNLFAESGFYTNRIRINEMLILFECAGFDLELIEVRRWDILPTPRKKMNKAFAEKTEDELRVSGFDVLLLKK